MPSSESCCFGYLVNTGVTGLLTRSFLSSEWPEKEMDLAFVLCLLWGQVYCDGLLPGLRFLLWGLILVCQGCHNQLPQPGRLKQQKCISSQFCKSEINLLVVLISPEASHLGVWMPPSYGTGRDSMRSAAQIVLPAVLQTQKDQANDLPVIPWVGEKGTHARTQV